MKFWPTLSSLLVLVLAIESKYLFFPPAQNQGGPPKEKGKGDSPPPLNLRTAILQNSALNQPYLSQGRISADQSVDLHFEISGILAKIFVKEKQKVRKGQLLFELQHQDLKAKIQGLENQLKWAGVLAQRNHKLFLSGALSKEEWDKSEQNWEQIRDELSYQKALSQKYQIRAPFDGTLGLISLDLGSLIQPQLSLASLYSSKSMVEFTLPQSALPSLALGQSLQVQMGEQKFSARIQTWDAALDSQSQSLRIRAELPQEMIPGTWVKIAYAPKGAQALMIPSTALSSDLKGAKVWLFKNGQAVDQSVQTGMRSADQVQISQGLKEGDTLILEKLSMLKKGMAVKALQGDSHGSR